MRLEIATCETGQKKGRSRKDKSCSNLLQQAAAPTHASSSSLANRLFAACTRKCPFSSFFDSYTSNCSCLLSCLHPRLNSKCSFSSLFDSYTSNCSCLLSCLHPRLNSKCSFSSLFDSYTSSCSCLPVMVPTIALATVPTFQPRLLTPLLTCAFVAFPPLGSLTVAE